MNQLVVRRRDPLAVGRRADRHRARRTPGSRGALANGVCAVQSYRIGKIERHILLWSYRLHTEEGRFHSKSGALLSYARTELKLAVPKQAKYVRRHLPRSVYNRLHVSFTRALRSLRAKGLIEYFSDARGLVAHADLELWALHEEDSIRYVRRSAFRMTSQGRKLAQQLYRERSN